MTDKNTYQAMDEICKEFNALNNGFHLDIPDHGDCDGESTWYLCLTEGSDFDLVGTGVGLGTLLRLITTFTPEKALDSQYL